MSEHFNSKVHMICLQQLKDHADDAMTKCVDALNRNMLHLHVEFLIQYTVWQSEAGHLQILKMRLNYK